MPIDKEVLTTGEVAKICNVAPRTVSKWFDVGTLKGYRIPGSKDRRIPVSELVKFMKIHGIPMDGLNTGRTRVLIVDSDPEVVGTLEQVLVDRRVGCHDEDGREVEVAMPNDDVLNSALDRQGAAAFALPNETVPLEIHHLSEPALRPGLLGAVVSSRMAMLRRSSTRESRGFSWPGSCSAWSASSTASTGPSSSWPES